MKKLISLKLIKQPKKTALCGAACIAMVTQYFSGKHSTLEEIWNDISDESPNGRRYCKTYKIGKYFNSNAYFATILRFKKLSKLLQYCENYQIPAIMNVHSFSNIELGHFVVFVKLNSNMVIIRDPENENNTVVNIAELKQHFTKRNEMDEIGGNIVILPYKSIENITKRECKKCGKINIIDSVLIEKCNDTIDKMICTNCDCVIDIQNQEKF